MCVLLELAEGREREERWYGVCVRKRKKWAAGDKKVSTMPGRFCRGAADLVRECGELMH